MSTNLRKYTVYFELYGKKMRVKVLAESEHDAKQVVKSDIKFHKIEYDKNDDYNLAMNFFDDLFK